MKKYSLDFKYIRNKQTAPLAVLSCILDAVRPPKDRNEKNLKKLEKVRTVFDSLTRYLRDIMKMDLDPSTILGYYDCLEILTDSNCFRNIDEKVKEVEKLVKEPIVIEFKGFMCDPEIMQFVPDFDKNKIKIVVLNPMFPSLETLSK